MVPLRRPPSVTLAESMALRVLSPARSMLPLSMLSRPVPAPLAVTPAPPPAMASASLLTAHTRSSLRSAGSTLGVAGRGAAVGTPGATDRPVLRRALAARPVGIRRTRGVSGVMSMRLFRPVAALLAVPAVSVSLLVAQG
jgi:hypothetical protein